MKIRNVERLRRKLRAIPAAAKAEIRKALGDSAEEIADLARRFVPVDSGELRDSIRWRFGDQAGNRKAVLSAKAGAAGHELSVTIEAGDSDAYYARFVEFGTAAAPAAQPFFYPAFRLGKKRAKGRIVRAINKAARKVAAGK